MISAGKLRHVVEVQSRTAGAGAAGSPTLAWTTLGTRRAGVEPLAGRELWQSKQVQADVTHRVTLRFYAGLTAHHRFRLLGASGDAPRVFQILSALDGEGETANLHVEHVCLCKEIV